MNPIVSVIMPAHNAELFIASSIKSVIEQSYENWELIVIDDASTDTTCTIVKKYLSDSRIHLITVQNNVGVAKARNIGALEAKSEYLAFLDSDDLWEKSKLEVQVNFHNMNPDVVLSHTNYVHLFQNGGSGIRIRNALTSKFRKSGRVFPILMYHNFIGTLTVMIKKNIFERYNGFDPEIFGGTEDWDLWLNISEDGYTFGYINKKLAMYRINPTGLSKKNIIKYKQALRFVLEKHLKIAKQKKSIISKSYANLWLIVGVTYYGSRNYKMSSLYFSKALRLIPTDIMLLFQLILYCIVSIIMKRF